MLSQSKEIGLSYAALYHPGSFVFSEKNLFDEANTLNYISDFQTAHSISFNYCKFYNKKSGLDIGLGYTIYDVKYNDWFLSTVNNSLLQIERDVIRVLELSSAYNCRVRTSRKRFWNFRAGLSALFNIQRKSFLKELPTNRSIEDENTSAQFNRLTMALNLEPSYRFMLSRHNPKWQGGFGIPVKLMYMLGSDINPKFNTGVTLGLFYRIE